MDNQPTQTGARARLAEVAENWVLRLNDRHCSAQERDEFAAWMARGDAERIAWERACRLWEQLGEVVRQPEFLHAKDAVLQRRSRWRRTHRAWWAAAACVVLMVLGPGVLAPRAPVPADTVQTGSGHIRHLSLTDGSTVTLDVGTRIEVRHDAAERAVTLIGGRAFFEVVPDPARPFVVQAGSGRVAVLGTRFQVEMGAEDRVEVVLVDGALRLQSDPSTDHDPVLVLAPGQSAYWTAQTRHWQTSVLDIQTRTAWSNGHLVFRDTPLREAIAEFNRYSPRPLEMADAEVARWRIHGVFRHGDVHSFALALEHLLPVEVLDDGERLLVLNRPGHNR